MATKTATKTRRRKSSVNHLVDKSIIVLGASFFADGSMAVKYRYFGSPIARVVDVPQNERNFVLPAIVQGGGRFRSGVVFDNRY